MVIVLTLLIFSSSSFPSHLSLCASCLQQYSIPYVHIMSTIVFNTICAHHVYNSIQYHLCTSCLQYYSILFVYKMSTIHSEFRSNSDQCAHHGYNSIQYHLCTSWLQYYSILFVHKMSTYNTFRSNSDQCAHHVYNTFRSNSINLHIMSTIVFETQSDS